RVPVRFSCRLSRMKIRAYGTPPTRWN
ncbi:dihydrolipoyl dehydrogenase, partial [Klebsiella pneumoniae]